MKTQDTQICTNCEHFNIFTGNSCRAFPKGIPDKIFKNGGQHIKLLNGQIDHYLFKLKPAAILDDRHQILNLFKSNCPKCIHFKHEIYSCEAFPWGIPEDILSGDNLHLSIQKGQTKAVVFTPEK